MRALLLAVMIVLLPLRGWMGDAMALNMALNTALNLSTNAGLHSPQHRISQPADHVENATDLVASYAIRTVTSGTFDHKNASAGSLEASSDLAHTPTDAYAHAHSPAGNPHTSGGTASFDGATASAHCDDTQPGQTCQSCQACHTVAITPVTALLPAAFSTPAVPQAAAIQFASADTALSQKPPISSISW